ncbi:691_t:CDS:2, partial [Diversispora eburnea]
MSKNHITSGKLVITGNIILKLHYGLEIMIQLNNTSFIIHIVQHVHSPLQPGYICEGGGQSNGITTNQPEIAQKLLEGVIFRLFIVELENIIVFISCLDKITKSNKKA